MLMVRYCIQNGQPIDFYSSVDSNHWSSFLNNKLEWNNSEMKLKYKMFNENLSFL